MNPATTTRRSAAETFAESQSADYSRDGFLIVRGVFRPEEVAALASEAQTLAERNELVDTNNIRCRWQDHCDSDECLFDCFDPVIDIGPVARAVANDERILAPLRMLLDDDAHLLKDKLIFKRPGAKGYALHQDYITWPEFPESFTTVIVAIDPSCAANGATEVFAGYHRRGYLSPRDGLYHELPESAVDPSHGVTLEMAAGDIAIFTGFTPHRSAPNRSDRWRRQLYLSYNADRDGGARREAHYSQFHEWLRQRYAEYGRTDVYFY
jgi:ectoine hydroxylase-related dioxygenase (phytanoyl-CoA dioxygenase family)